MEITAQGEPIQLLDCFCDDCHTRVKVCQTKEKPGTQYNKFSDDFAEPCVCFAGQLLSITRGKEQLEYFRAPARTRARKTTTTAQSA